MFGYIKPQSAELKVKEYEFYKSVYCGLCRSLNGQVSYFSEFTLSYDFVFLALFRMAAVEEAMKITPRRCALHPLKKRPAMENNPSLTYSAVASALLTYYKIKDDIHDSRGIKKILPLTALPLVCGMKNGISEKTENIRELDNMIRQGLDTLSALEKANTDSVDAPADAFGKILAGIFSFGLSDKASFRIASEVGYHTGCFIYVIDALDDLEKDRQKNNYNPFLLSPLPSGETLKSAMILHLIGIERAVGLMAFHDIGIENIIKNIIYLGMPACIDKVLEKFSGPGTESAKADGR